MTIKERINMIMDLVLVMSNEEWSKIDLVLGQHGFETRDRWNGEKEFYIQAMIETESDEKLQMLAEFYDMYDETDSDKSCSWKPDGVCVFLSHLSSDKKRATKIQKELECYNISSFVAQNDIRAGSKWQDEIEKALMGCDALIALLVPGFHKSDWTDQEIGYVMGRGKKIIAVELGMELYGFIGKFQGVQGDDKTEYGIAEEIFKVLAKDKRTSKKMSNAIINKFKDVSSYAEAKLITYDIECLDYLDEQMIESIRYGLENNSQVYNSFGVPERLEYIIKRHKKM